MSVGDEVQLVTFRLGGQDFALNIFQVERILRYQTPAALPKAPAYLEGVVSYGGAVVPVVDLRKRVDIDAPVRDDTRIMILEHDGGRIGVVVDAVLEVLKVPAQRVSPPPPVVQGLAAEYISGIVSLEDRTIVVIAAGRLLSSTERLALEQLTVEAAHD
ncbi:MAG: chemotaxis protein CheW [Gemmatimonadales bacterium]|nr:chemotaxis protein CheW [Gemmatimonadales bacterium]NIN49997.1 chemotaxis protein CheW [Gemmatimonadales bacterium]NIP07461.1 chemotaxis protein CheW [Gemmatimonadales bacterium]NIR03100.1 chemotaxis protein CheW [Gemmatimonadales bacterium]NIS66812.1 chemotaxis protein CheW [Gemmatimonadales bacterium]